MYRQRTLPGLVVLLVAASCATHSLAGGPEFRLDYKKKGLHDLPNQMEVTATRRKGVMDIRSQFGIGSGSIHLVRGHWPREMVVRLYLGGLEGFSISNGTSTVSREDVRVRMMDKDGKPLPGKYLPREQVRQGYYEVQLPARLLGKGVTTLEISWVDFYRR
ncbi:MAG: hypothetical protein QGH11_02090 [Pirellulaceae bacterium]|nr:hypothetical protein [Pirellulaceae bacterium]